MTQLTFSVTDANFVTLTPPATTVTREPGDVYMITAQPLQTYEVRLVSNHGLDTGWTRGPVTHSFTVDATDLLVNVLTQVIPHATESEDPVVLLRAYTGEIVPPGGSDADTMFEDAFLGSLYDQFGGDMLRAAAHVWLMKSAEYARLIDLDESGATRKLTQRYKQAKDMYEQLLIAADNLDAVGAGAVRVGGRVVNLRTNGTDDQWRVLGEYISNQAILLGDNIYLDMTPGGVIKP